MLVAQVVLVALVDLVFVVVAAAAAVELVGFRSPVAPQGLRQEPGR